MKDDKNVVKETPQVEATPEKVVAAPEVAKKKFPLLLVIISFLLLAIVAAAIFFWPTISAKIAGLNIWKKNSDKQENADADADADEEADDTEGDVAAVALSDNKIFYVYKNNVYSYDVVTETQAKLTNYPANPTNTPAYDGSGAEIPSIDIRSVRVIDGDTIGFGKCAVVKGDFGCGVYTFDLQTNTATLAKALIPTALLETVNFYDGSNFAYEFRAGAKWKVVSSKNGVESNLENVTVAQEYGRGGYVEDDEDIQYSPDGTHVLQISTSSPRGTSDFKVYVYNLTNGSKEKISNATQPVWLDNTQIIYRNIGKGIYVYDINTNHFTKYAPIAKDSYKPEVLTGNTVFVYTDYKNLDMYKFDIGANTKTKIIDNGMLGYYVNDTKVVYSEVAACAGAECEEMMDNPGFTYEDVKVVDLVSGDVQTVPDLESVYGSASKHN